MWLQVPTTILHGYKFRILKIYIVILFIEAQQKRILSYMDNKQKIAYNKIHAIGFLNSVQGSVSR